MHEQLGVLYRLRELSRQWKDEANTLDKYGDAKTAAVLREHATIMEHLAGMAHREAHNNADLHASVA